MKIEVLLPQVGESITEATISKWRKAVGERVEKNEILLDISTEKVDTEVPAPEAGTIVELRAKEGDVVAVKSIIAIIDTEGKAKASAPAKQKTPEAKAPEAKAPELKAKPVETAQRMIDDEQPYTAPAEEEAVAHGKFYSPLVQTMAFKFGISDAELETVQGSGQGGRVTKQDLLDYVDRKEGKKRPAPPAADRHLEPAAPPVKEATTDWTDEGTKAITMDTMRATIADHMVRSKQTSPHVYSVQEIDVSAIARWRKARQSEFEKQEGFKLSFTPFFLEAAVRALIKFPYANASLDGKKIILKRHINLGCAVALGDPAKGAGLIVPVIRHAEEKSFVGLARSLNDLATRARNKKLLPDDVAGGTFTVTNPGVFGTLIGTPIINQPQVAILCLGAIEKRPVVVDDMIAIRERCYLTLSYDHRVIDGALSGNFLGEIKRYLENWPADRPLL